MTGRKIRTLHYIHFMKMTGRRNKIETEEKEIAGIKMVTVKLHENKRRKKQEVKEKLLNKMQRKLRKYELQSGIVSMTSEMVQFLEIEEVLFELRKAAFLEDRDLIIRELKPTGNADNRSSMVLILESEAWSRREILMILITAKDYYREIYLMMKETFFDAEQVQNIMYDEWGVMVSVVEKEEEIKEAEFGLLLSKEWDESFCKKTSFTMTYQVEEIEKFPISIVAIYGQEW